MSVYTFDADNPRPMRNYLGRMWAARRLTFHLAAAQLRSRLRRSALGVVWLMVNPVIMALIFTLVFGQLFGSADIVRYSVYVLVGTVFFEIFSQSVNVGAASFLDGLSYMRQSRLPSAMFPLRTVLYLFICFLLALIGTCAVGYATGKMVFSINLLYLIPCLGLFFLMLLPLAIISAIANIKYGDFSQISNYVMLLIYYTTPVFIPRHLFDRPELYLIELLSPAVAMLDIGRDILMAGQVPDAKDVIVVACWTVVLWIFAVIWLRSEEQKIVYYS